MGTYNRPLPKGTTLRSLVLFFFLLFDFFFVSLYERLSEVKLPIAQHSNEKHDLDWHSPLPRDHLVARKTFGGRVRRHTGTAMTKCDNENNNTLSTIPALPPHEERGASSNNTASFPPPPPTLRSASISTASYWQRHEH